MEALGSQLRAERENRGLRRVDVSKATKVCAHHLAAIEHGNLGDLPDADEVEGYVRTYAAFLELDAEALVEAFRLEHGATHATPAAATRPEVIVETVPGAASEPPPDAVSDDRAATNTGTETDSRKPFPLLPLVAGAIVLSILSIAAVWLVATRDSGAPGSPGPEADDSAPIASISAAPETEPAIDPVDAGAEASQVDSAPAAAPSPASVPQTRSPPRTAVEPAGEVAAPTPSGNLSISEHGVGSGVVNHRLVGESAEFPEGSRVWFWTRVVGGTSGQRIVHVWTREGRLMDRIELKLGASNWRTQSRKTLYGTGSWAVEARDRQGNVLARSEFTCAPK